MGKFIGAFLGLVFLGPFFSIGGAVIGFFLGSMFDSFARSTISFDFNSFENNNDSLLVDTLPVFTSKITSVSGNSKEIILMARAIFIREFGAQKAQQILTKLKYYNITGVSDLELRLAVQKVSYSGNVTALEYIIRILQEILEVKGNVTLNELNAFSEILALFGIKTGNYQRSGRGYRSESESTFSKNIHNDPYDVLELSSSASNDEIKKQYRSLSKKYHPDLATNLADEEKEKSEIKMRELNEAYEILKKKRRLK